MSPELIALRGVCRTFAAGQPDAPEVRAVHGVDLRIRYGEFVAVTGPSGSGKSTLLNLLGLLDTPTGGEYRLGGRAVHGLRERDRTRARASMIGFVFQSFHLIEHKTVLENVVTGLAHAGLPRATRRAHAGALLAQVGLAGRLHCRPAVLSGGERQRVAIARAVVRRPGLLLCDEPTGNLDSRTTRGVLDLLEHLHGAGQTVIVVTHDEYVAGRAPRRVRMRDGEISDDRVQ